MDAVRPRWRTSSVHERRLLGPRELCQKTPRVEGWLTKAIRKRENTKLKDTGPREVEEIEVKGSEKGMEAKGKSGYICWLGVEGASADGMHYVVMTAVTVCMEWVHCMTCMTCMMKGPVGGDRELNEPSRLIYGCFTGAWKA